MPPCLMRRTPGLTGGCGAGAEAVEPRIGHAASVSAFSPDSARSGVQLCQRPVPPC
jgi:hypothetical protein